MDFEDILKEIGGFGFYQKLLVGAFLMPAFVVIPWFSLNLIFMTNTPEHWCYVPELVHSNLSLEIQKSLIRPPSDQSCSMYDIDYRTVLETGNWTVDATWPTKHCDKGWTYDTSNYDATAVTAWDMVCHDSHYSSLALSLIFIGDVIGTPVYGYLSDRIGRKPTFLIMAAIIAVTEIGSVLSPYFALFLILRTINGTCMSTIYGVAYIILLELVTPDLRARMNGITTTSWTLGLCLLPLIAWQTRNWFYLSIVTTCTAFGLLLYAKVLPESPSWLISQERYDEATDIMIRISKANGSTAHEGTQLQQKILKLGEKIKKQRDSEEKYSPIDFFKYPTLRKRFILVTVCWLGNSIPYFGLQMNVKNLGGNEFLNFFLVSIVEIPAHLCTWLFMERIGRRWCSVCAFVITTIACILPVIFSSVYAPVGVVASLIAKAGTSSAFMTLYQQGPELFPTALRGVGLGMSGTIGTGSTLMVPYIVYLARYGTYIPFLIFAIITMISCVCASFLPETLNRKLPQTVADAENFEKHRKFFSCSQGCEPDEEAGDGSNWQPATLSAEDLTRTIQDSMSKKILPCYEKRDSMSSVVEAAMTAERNIKAR